MGDGELEDLLAECIDRILADGEGAADSLLEEHPRSAEHVRTRLAELRGMGLFGDATQVELPAETLGEFRLLRKLGEGGMGVVYLARQSSVDRVVALKVIHPLFATNERMAERFRREAQALAKLRHPNAAAVISSGLDRGFLYTAMELVPGEGLDRLLERRRESGERVEPREALSWTRDVARALGAAHDAGIVHRDVKPSNIRLTSDGRAVLIDFGLARDAARQTITRSGQFQGSPHYASPEQVAGRTREIGPETDVYSLGVTLFECVTGALPFAGETAELLFARIVQEGLPRPRSVAPELPRDLETVILGATALSPAHRYRTGAELADDLDALLTFRPIRARPPGPARRAALWARRNRRAAMSLLVIALLGIGVGVGLYAQGLRAARERRGAALATMNGVRSSLLGLAGTRERELELLAEIEARRATLHQRHQPLDAWRVLDADVDAAEGRREEREDLIARLRGELDRLAEMDPPLEGMDALRAMLEMEQWRFAHALGERARARVLRRLVEGLAPGEYTAEFEGVTPCAITSDPPGAEVFLYRYQDLSRLVAGEEPRLVPVPIERRATDPRPGTWCLRVTGAVPPLEKGDLIVELAGRPIRDTLLVVDGNDRVQLFDALIEYGGRVARTPIDGDLASNPPTGPAASTRFRFERAGEVVELEGPSLQALGIRVAEPRRAARLGEAPAVVLRGEERFETTLPPGLDLVTTAAPLFAIESARVGETPLEDLMLPAGAYVALLVAEGHERARVPVFVARGEAQLAECRLLPADSGPPGFVPVGSGGPLRLDPFWIQERETTFEEYVEFLNDPDTSERIDRSPQPTLFPRSLSGAQYTSFLPRGADGRYSLGGVVGGEMPVFFVSQEDALAYADWRTERAERVGDPWVFDLPSMAESRVVRNATPIHVFVSGAHFRPSWIKSAASAPHVGPEPVLRYPIDESPFGVFDLSGSLREWTRDVSSPDTYRGIYGSAWDITLPEDFRLEGEAAQLAYLTFGVVGFRLVAHPR